jgi:hypothetical protein
MLIRGFDDPVKIAILVRFNSQRAGFDHFRRYWGIAVAAQMMQDCGPQAQLLVVATRNHFT